LFYELFKRDDGSGSLVPKDSKETPVKSLFVETFNKDGKKNVFYVDPMTRKLSFHNRNGSLRPSLGRNKLLLSWSGDIKCKETASTVNCDVDGAPVHDDTDSPAVNDTSFKEKMNRFRYSPEMKKSLKWKRQSREKVSFDGEIDLWSEPRTNVLDINSIAMGTGAGIGFLGAASTFFLPVATFAIMTTPLLIGVPLIATIETLDRSTKTRFHFDEALDDNRWFGNVDIPPSLIKDITVLQDDEYYFHAKVGLRSPVSCLLSEESDVISYHPNRRLTCRAK
jgi:hypothetical protein